MHKAGDKEIMHGQIASPQEACGYDINPKGGGGVMGGDVGFSGAGYRESSGEIATVTYDPLNPGPGQTIGSGGNLATPMDQQGGSIGATGQASGTGATGSGKISTPWSGPFGDTVK